MSDTEGDSLEDYRQLARKALAQSLQARQRGQRLIEEIRANQLASWQRLAGPRLADLLTDRTAAVACLRELDAKLRQVALQVVAHIWGADAEYARACYLLLASDPDLDVRITAASCLAISFRGTGDPNVGKALAQIVADRSESVLLRDIAYQGLFEVRGLPVEMWPIMDAKSAGERFPDQVDWVLVASFLKPG